MPMQEVPLKDWGDFLERFSKSHEGCLIQLEIYDRKNVSQISSRPLFLKSITAEPSKNGRSPIVIIVGGDKTTEVGQLVRHPSRLLLRQDSAGDDEEVEIYSDQWLFVVRSMCSVREQAERPRTA